MSTIHDESTTEFVDVLCDDPDWLRAEFDELIAAVWDQPPAQRPPSPPQRPAPLPHPHRPVAEHRRTSRAVHPSDPLAHERSPPN
jgi:hypothetical protein